MSTAIVSNEDGVKTEDGAMIEDGGEPGTNGMAGGTGAKAAKASKNGKKASQPKGVKAKAPADPVFPKAMPKTTTSKAGKKASSCPASGLPDDRSIRDASILLKQASDPTRLKIMLLLEGGEKNVGELCEVVRQSQPAASHHLALLRHGRLVQPRRDGKHNFYELTDTGRKVIEVVKAAL